MVTFVNILQNGKPVGSSKFLGTEVIRFTHVELVTDGILKGKTLNILKYFLESSLLHSALYTATTFYLRHGLLQCRSPGNLLQI